VSRNLQVPRVGDRVRIVHVYEGDDDGEYIGKTGKVLYACAPEYDVLLDGLGGGYAFYDGELEVIEQEVTGL
jgi:hypothetical protein